MDVSPNVLRKETVDTLKQVNDQIEAVTNRAKGFDVPVERLIDHNGNFILVPLLLAKAQCLNTLVLLSQKK